MSKGISLDGEQLKQLRLAKGWRVADLAAKARCSEKTVQNAEKGEPVYTSSAAAIAAALSVELAALLVGRASPKRIKVGVVIEGNFGDSLELNIAKLVEMIKLLLPALGEIKVVDTKEGSLIVTLEMDEGDMLRLVALFPKFKEVAMDFIEQEHGLAMLSSQMGKYPHETILPDSNDEIMMLKKFVIGIKELRVESE